MESIGRLKGCRSVWCLLEGRLCERVFRLHERFVFSRRCEIGKGDVPYS